MVKRQIDISKAVLEEIELEIRRIREGKQKGILGMTTKEFLKERMAYARNLRKRIRELKRS